MSAGDEPSGGGEVRAFRTPGRSPEPRDALGLIHEVLATHPVRAVYVAVVTDQADGVHIHDDIFGDMLVTEATHIGAMLHERAFGRRP